MILQAGARKLRIEAAVQRCSADTLLVEACRAGAGSGSYAEVQYKYSVQALVLEHYSPTQEPLPCRFDGTAGPADQCWTVRPKAND